MWILLKRVQVHLDYRLRQEVLELKLHEEKSKYTDAKFEMLFMFFLLHDFIEPFSKICWALTEWYDYDGDDEWYHQHR